MYTQEQRNTRQKMVHSVMQQEILYQSVLYFQTDAHSHGTRVNVLSTDTHDKSTTFTAPIFTKPAHAEPNYMRIS